MSSVCARGTCITSARAAFARVPGTLRRTFPATWRGRFAQPACQGPAAPEVEYLAPVLAVQRPVESLVVEVEVAVAVAVAGFSLVASGLLQAAALG